MSVAPITSFAINRTELASLNQDQMTDANKIALKKRGGVEALAKALNVDIDKGLLKEEGDQQYSTRRQVFGSNVYPEPPIKTWCALFIESFNDPTLLILLVAAAVSLVVGFIEHPEQGWIEGTTIFLACLIVAFVTATNDYEKDKQFRALKGESDDILIKVLRDGQQRSVSTFDINVGDIIILEAGDKIPGDLVFIKGENCKANESSLTGEPDDKVKSETKDPFFLSGCNLVGGRCHALCIAVGEESRWGRIKAKLAVEQQQTPLQEKLDRMAALVGYFGGGMAFLTFIAMMILLAADETILIRRNMTLAAYIINAFIIAVTIVVVAIPEGLPLAVTISLAYSTKKMLKDKNLIRVLAACETMGNATNICSDKTGTLTENRMTVVAGWFGDEFYNQDRGLPSFAVLPSSLKKDLMEGLGLNSTAILEFSNDMQKWITVGSKTEGALLQIMSTMSKNDTDPIDTHFYNDIRTQPKTKVFSFSSARKLSSILVPHGTDGYRLYVKGASEIVLGHCTSYVTKLDSVEKLDKDKKEMLSNDVITKMAKDALRTIAIGYCDFTKEEISDPKALDDDWGYTQKCTLQAIVGIIDPLRDDVIEAVKTCQSAGIMVRMVTGDNLETAKAIAKRCGILTAGGIALEGPTFRKMTPAQLDAILPKLQVLARSSPDDKHTLVTRLNGKALPKNEEEWKEHHPDNNWETERNLILPGYWKEWSAKYGNDGEVVGVTGDGTNDAPALKAGDVGLSMGLSGTDVAKEASDIVILDDKFSSIVKAVLWGRCVYDNIRKFLQFQLTVNVVALCLVFIAACLDGATPLNAIMMLWVNLIMDTMGALALGTEMPKDELLEVRQCFFFFLFSLFFPLSLFCLMHATPDRF
jgi:P-type Ca2+ transporter type 2C